MIIKLKEFLNKVVTIKTLTGLELIGKFIGNKLIVITHPKMVVLTNSGDNQDNSIAVVPFTFSSVTEQIDLSTNKILSISESIKECAEDYLKIVEGETEETPEDDS